MVEMKKRKGKVKNTLKFIGILLFFIVLIYFLEGWGWLGLIIFILGIVLMRCIRQRNFLKFMMRQIEMIVWGKPLDKDMWNKNEMKNTKLKIVWGTNKFDWNKYIVILVYPSLLLLFIGVMWDITSVTVISIVMFSIIILVKGYYLIRRLIKNVKSKRNQDKSSN
jgi:phosphatidylglycerophosphate synthase